MLVLLIIDSSNEKKHFNKKTRKGERKKKGKQEMIQVQTST